MTSIEYGPPDEGTELDDYAALLNRCFGHSGKVEESRRWVGRQSPKCLRTLREGSNLLAALSLIDMGQFFGGSSVRTAGVAGVGIEPDRRGQGLAKRLMTSFLEECHRDGYPISTLYASTYRLYESVGYGRAGARWRASVQPSLLAGYRGALQLRRATEDDEGAMEECWRQFARLHPGQLDRGDYIHTRVRTPRPDVRSHACVLAASGGELEGYVRWIQVDSDDGLYELLVCDYAALTEGAARGILSLFADHSSLAPRVRWPSGPGDPLLALLPDRYYELALADVWMVRVVDVAAALEARGYAPGVRAELHLEVEDELLPWNHGRFVLSVADGRGSVAAGGEGRIQIDPRGLAPLYSGYQSPAQIAATGRLRAAQPELESAGAVFAAPSPWMTDMF